MAITSCKVYKQFALVMQNLQTITTLDNQRIIHYNIWAIGVWRSLVSRLVRVQEASGSNPDTPTKIRRVASAALLIFTGLRDLKD